MCESFKRQYQLCDEIGRGRFGVVFRCFSPSSHTSFAVKSIDKRLLLDDETDRECLDKEPKILQILSPHPNILQIHDIFDSDSHLLIVTDLCQESTLYDRVVSAGPFSETDACSVFTQLIDALAHCHRNYICHRCMHFFSTSSCIFSVLILDLGFIYIGVFLFWVFFFIEFIDPVLYKFKKNINNKGICGLWISLLFLGI